MDDLISRQEAIEHLKKRLYETAHNIITEHPYYEELADNRIDAWLNELPSAERRARWKKCKKNLFFPDDDIFTCSECFHNYFKQTNYCPNCGARMEV